MPLRKLLLAGHRAPRRPATGERAVPPRSVPVPVLRSDGRVMDTPQRVLITGAGGFTGEYLAAHLRETTAAHVVGLDVAPAARTSRIDHVQCDLEDADRLARVVRDVRPDTVFHLVARARGTPEPLRRINVGGFITLCRALRAMRHAAGRPMRVVTVGSAAEIGSAGFHSPPVDETVICRPETDYGRTKHEVTRLALAEPTDGPLQVVVARTFNLVGPGMSEQLSLGSFARQIAAVLRREAEAVHCGPLDARRDFVDVRDAVRAYAALATSGRAGHVYNVCTGRSHHIGDLLSRMISFSGADVPVVAGPSARDKGPVDARGDPGKLCRETGWWVSVSIERSLADLLQSALSPRDGRRSSAA